MKVNEETKANKIKAKKSLSLKEKTNEALSGAEREHCLDLFRGLCLLGIILNHTCFHSGSSYIPDSWAQWTMLLDVPALFFVSGMTYRTINRDMIVNSLFKFAMVFTILSIVLNAIYKRFSWDYVWKPLFLNSLDLPEYFLSIQQAYWFVPVYVAVLIIATIILKKIRDLYGLVIVGCLGLYFYCFFEKIPFFNGVILGASLQQIFFYLSIFLFGFFCKDKVIGRVFQKKVACFLLVFALGVYYLTYVYRGWVVFNLFLNKFPPKLPYIALSFISISVFIFFYKAERKNFWIEYIGRNAIYYYAGQGIGAVSLFSVVPHVVLPFYFKLPLMFLCNLMISGAVAEVLKLIYNGFGRCYRILTENTKANKIKAKKSLSLKEKINEALSGAEREHCLDLFRGVCLLGIIFEHTCLISGSSYVPGEWARWTMLLDVPALFFISGMTCRTINRDMIVNSLFKLSIVFTLLSVILNGVYGRFDWNVVWKPLFLSSVDYPDFYLSAQQSYWFVPVYVAVLIIATIILKLVRDLYGLIIVACLGLYFYCFFANAPFLEGKILGESVQQIFFYLSVFLFGFFCKDKVIGQIFQKEVACFLLVFALGVYYLTYLSEGDFVFNLFLNKFPAKLPFIALSFISIAVFVFFYKAERKNFVIEHIGQNAIYYYAGQGIGASLLYGVVPYVSLQLCFKLPLMFLCNLMITAAVAEVLKLIYNGFGRYYRILTENTKA